MIHHDRACLILIDLQEGFREAKWGARNNPLLERNVASCLAAFRAAGRPVIHVRHDSNEADSPLRSGTRGFAFLPEAAPRGGEEVFTKRAHGAFVGTPLELYLKRRSLSAPVFAGLTVDHCVSTSVRMANDLGFEPMVVEDASATFPRRTPQSAWLPADDVQAAALASLDGEFARVVNTAFLIRHLRRISGNPPL